MRKDIIAKTDYYEIVYDKQKKEILFVGTIRGEKDTEINKFRTEINEILLSLGYDENLIFNIINLKYLNSSGIDAVYRLIIDCGDIGINLTIKCNYTHFWQSKIVPNFKKFNQSVVIIEKEQGNIN